MLVTSRSFQEYRACFARTDADLRARIRDCAAGDSGVAAAAGGTAVAVDPAYAAEPAAPIEGVRRSTARGALHTAAAEAFARDPALCSHLLFTWSNRFDGALHERALRELIRVAAAVRVERVEDGSRSAASACSASVGPAGDRSARLR